MLFYNYDHTYLCREAGSVCTAGQPSRDIIQTSTSCPKMYGGIHIVKWRLINTRWEEKGPSGCSAIYCVEKTHFNNI